MKDAVTATSINLNPKTCDSACETVAKTETKLAVNELG